MPVLKLWQTRTLGTGVRGSNLNDHDDLLKQLRIEREQREDHDTRHTRWLWIVGAVIVLALIAAGAAFYALRGQAVEVQAATAIAPAAAGDSAAVLQATGYVVARREATVSAQITGTLTEVLIE